MKWRYCPVIVLLLALVYLTLSALLFDFRVRVGVGFAKSIAAITAREEAYQAIFQPYEGRELRPEDIAVIKPEIERWRTMEFDGLYEGCIRRGFRQRGEPVVVADCFYQVDSPVRALFWWKHHL